jgi:hypothetical protein
VTRGGFDVVDCHHHVGTLEAVGLSAGPSGLGSHEAMERDMAVRIQTMDNTGVDQAILAPGHGYLRPKGLEDTRRINDQIAAYRDARPDRFPAALGIVEPLYGKDGLAELDRIHSELGLAGVSFHARWQGVATNSPLVIELVRRMSQLHLVPFLHGAAEVADEALWKLQEVARCEPETTMIVLDAFSAFEQGEHALRIAEDTPNLIFDTSLVFGTQVLQRFIDRVGSHRLVFGTDVYAGAQPLAHNRRLDSLFDLSLDENGLRAVLAGNLREILRRASIN